MKRRTADSLALYGAGLLIRVALLVYGEWQDSVASRSPLGVRYTDVDFFVVSDAAAFVSRGRSPYLRATYRYSPLLAVALSPFASCPSLGKLLFSVLDLFTARFLSIAAVSSSSSSSSSLSSSLMSFFFGGGDVSAPLSVAAWWLLNPISINLTTRGSHEAIVCCLVAASLLCLRRRRVVALAVLLGVAVHVRIYPIIYCLPILFYLRGESSSSSSSSSSSRGDRRRWCVLSGTQWIFGIVCFGSFALLTGLCFAAYGSEFLQHAYLYHLGRVDHRHNLSPHWPSLYFLAFGGVSSPPSLLSSVVSALASFVPQVAAMGAVGWRFIASSRIGDVGTVAFGMWAMTVIFVAFNKVYTAQYFAWWLVLVPLSGLHRLVRPPVSAALALGWVTAFFVWLSVAYRLEFLGDAVVMQLWAAGLALFCASVLPVAVLCHVKSRGMVRRGEAKQI